jgi:hypothetical protein
MLMHALKKLISEQIWSAQSAHLGRTHGIARDADDAVLLAQQIERLDRLLGEADQPAGWEMTQESQSIPAGAGLRNCRA